MKEVRFRVNVYQAVDAEQPDGDLQIPIVRIPYMRNDVTIVTGHESLPDSVRLREVRSRLGWEGMIRWLNIIGNCQGLSLESHDRNTELYAVPTDEWLKECGLTFDQFMANGGTEVYTKEWSSYFDGDVHHLRGERLVRMAEVDEEGNLVYDGEEVCEWRDIGTIWNYYGHKWAVEQAKEFFDLTAEKGPAPEKWEVFEILEEDGTQHEWATGWTMVDIAQNHEKFGHALQRLGEFVMTNLAQTREWDSNDMTEEFARMGHRYMQEAGVLIPKQDTEEMVQFWRAYARLNGMHVEDDEE